jgi:hypothetical protein
MQQSPSWEADTQSVSKSSSFPGFPNYHFSSGFPAKMYAFLIFPLGATCPAHHIQGV